MSSTINPLITDAGLAAAVAASGLGLQLAITHIALGTGQYTPSVGLTALAGRKEKVAIPSGYVTGSGGFRINALFPSWAGTPNPYNATEIGFYAGDPDAGGILFAVHSHTSAVIVQRNSLDYVVQFSMQLTRVPAGSVTVTVDPGASQMLALMAAHEAAADPHPVYVLKSNLAALVSAAGDYKASVRVGTVGANITLAGSAPNTLDGVTLVANDRILVKDQSTGSQNGLYYVATLGTGANGTWTRATDADAAGELTPGMVVTVEEGTLLADTTWELSTDGPITIGTTALTFKQGGFVTPAQFDNSTKVETTAFGKIRGIEASGVTVLTATGNITAAHMGGTVIMNNGSAATMTIPAANSVPPGARVDFLAIGTALTTIQRAGSDIIVGNNSSVTSLTFGAGDSLTLESNGLGQWYAVGGTAQLSYSASFASSLGGNGYQKLPSGLILQWGAVAVVANVGFPLSWNIVFPTAILSVLVTLGGGAVAKTGYNSATVSGATIIADSGGPMNWLAIGI